MRTQNERIYIFSAKILEKKCHHLHLQLYFADLTFEVEKFNIFLYEFFSTHGDILSPLIVTNTCLQITLILLSDSKLANDCI